MPQPSVPDVICTLTTKDRATRGLEWADLGALALSHERLPNGIASSYDAALADDIADLATRERDCCGTWLNIEVRRSGDQIRLTATTANPNGQAMIRSAMGFETG